MSTVVAYTLADMQSAVIDDLADPNFSATRVTRYLNYGVNRIFNTHMFKFCEKSVSGSLTTNNYTFNQQSDWETTIGGVLYNATNTAQQMILSEETYLNPRDFFESYPLPSANTAGLPSYWTEYGQQIYFNRPVDNTYTLLLRYYRYPTQMSAGTDVPDVPSIFRDIIELYAEFRAEKFRGNHDIAATYLQEFEDGLENMVVRYAERTQVAASQMRNARS